MSCQGFYIELRNQFFSLALFTKGFGLCHLNGSLCITLVTSKSR